MAEQVTDPGDEAAFGVEFRPLMMRIRRAFDAPANGEGTAPERPLSWREVSRSFEREAEARMAKHRLEMPLATYVRHIVREGFDVDFDPMAPPPHR